MNLLIVLSSLIMLLLAGSCSQGNSGGTLPVIIDRQATLVAWRMENGKLSERIISEISGLGPVEVAMVIGTVIDPPPGSNDGWIIKHELDFGDGQGWIDVSEEAGNWDHTGTIDERDVNRLTRHVYTEPGEYLIRGRVTYWDGEVISTTGNPALFLSSSDVLVRVMTP